jgi:hypothetical protein
LTAHLSGYSYDKKYFALFEPHVPDEPIQLPDLGLMTIVKRPIIASDKLNGSPIVR